MAETGVVGFWGPAELAALNNRTLGQDANVNLAKLSKGNGVAFRFPKNPNVSVDVYTRVPLAGALTTGVTFEFLLTDDGNNAADLGKVGVMGVTAKYVATDTDSTDVTVAGATEVTANCTLNAASGIVEVVTVAVANANLDSLAVSKWALFRLRRVGSSASDTLQGPLLCLGVYAFAY